MSESVIARKTLHKGNAGSNIRRCTRLSPSSGHSVAQVTDPQSNLALAIPVFIDVAPSRLCGRPVIWSCRTTSAGRDMNRQCSIRL